MTIKTKIIRTRITTYQRLANREGRKLMFSQLTKGDSSPITQDDIDAGWPNDEEGFQYWIRRRDAAIAEFVRLKRWI